MKNYLLNITTKILPESITSFFKELTLGKKILLLLTPIISVVASMKLFIIGLWLLVLVDFVTGIRKTLHKKGVKFNPFKKVFWTSIKSYLIRKTWKKNYEYGIGILVVVVFESMIFGITPITLMSKTFTLSELAVLIPAGIELWSIFENMEAVSGRNVLKRMLKFLPAFFTKLFKGDGKGNNNTDK